MSDIDCPDLKSANEAMYGEIKELRVENERLAAQAKPLSAYSDDEIAREHHWRMQRRLGDPRLGVGPRRALEGK